MNSPSIRRQRKVRSIGRCRIGGLPLESANVYSTDAFRTPLIGRHRKIAVAAAILSQNAVISRVDSRAAGEQGVCQRRPAIVVQRPEQRVNANNIAVHTVCYPARRSSVADKIMAGRFNGAGNVRVGIPCDYRIPEPFQGGAFAGITKNTDAVAGDSAVGNGNQTVVAVGVAVSGIVNPVARII